jgi:PEP-CTERM motif
MKTGALLVVVASLCALPLCGGAIWLGNDTVGDVFETTTTGMVLNTVSNLPITGIAWNGTDLFFADPGGNFTRRSPDGNTVLGSFTTASGDTGEDLAFDPVRDSLWRIVHTNVLQQISASTGTLANSYNLPTADPILGTLGGLGIAYDSRRDLLYVSYCSVGCSSLSAGLVQTVNPNTGAVLGDLFRTSGFATGGLGYDSSTDTLWVGDLLTVRNMDLSGNVLSSFSRPQPAGFADGLEFVPTAVPEPATTALMCAGLLGIAFRAIRRNLS